MSYDYKNIIKLKDDVDEALANKIKAICLELYNKGQNLVKLVEVEKNHFELVSNKSGKNNLLIGMGLAQRDDLVLNNIKYWYWQEPNKFECGDILNSIRELERKN